MRCTWLLFYAFLFVAVSALDAGVCPAPSATQFLPDEPSSITLPLPPKIEIALPALLADSLAIELTDQSEPLLSLATVFVAFYSPWATEWKNASVEFYELAKQMRANGSSIFFAEVNCVKEHKLRNRYIGLQTYPVFMYLHLGKPITYYGVLRAQQMAAFLHRCEGLFTKTLSTLDELYAMFDREERSIVAIFPTPAQWSLFRSQADALIPKFIRAVNESGLYLHVATAVVRSDIVMKHFGGIQSEGTLVLYDRTQCLLKPVTAPLEELNAWIDREDNRYVFWTNKDLVGFSDTTPNFIWIFETRDGDMQTLRAVAEKYKDRVRVLLMDGLRYPSLLLTLGFPYGVLPVGAFLNVEKRCHYAFTPASPSLLEGELDEFLGRCLVGAATPYRKISQLNAGNFHDTVQSTKAATGLAVLYFQPWHGASKVAELLWDHITPSLRCSVEMVKYNLRLTDPPHDLPLRSYPQVSVSPSSNRSELAWFGGPWTRTALHNFICNTECSS